MGLLLVAIHCAQPSALSQEFHCFQPVLDPFSDSVSLVVMVSPLLEGDGSWRKSTARCERKPLFTRQLAGLGPAVPGRAAAAGDPQPSLGGGVESPTGPTGPALGAARSDTWFEEGRCHGPMDGTNTRNRTTWTPWWKPERLLGIKGKNMIPGLPNNYFSLVTGGSNHSSF